VALIDFVCFEGDSELTMILKFLKRAMETFGRNHGLQLRLNSEGGARVMEESGRCLRKLPLKIEI